MAKQKSERFGLKSIVEQVRILREYFPSLGNGGYCRSLIGQKLPLGATGWLALPRYWHLSRWNSYQEATHTVWVNLVHNLFGKEISVLGNYKYGATELRERHLKQTKLNQLYEAQSSIYQKEFIFNPDAPRQQFEILILPVRLQIIGDYLDLPKRHKYPADQLALGLFDLYILLLTHPEIFLHRRELLLNCQGDEYFRDTDITGRANIPAISLLNENNPSDSNCTLVEMAGFSHFATPA